MHTKTHWLHQFPNTARLGIMPRPRGGEWLENEIIHLQKQGVALIVSLLEQSETEELQLEKEKELCLKHNIHFINFPVKDRSIAINEDKLALLLNEMNEKIKQKGSVVIHCRMGIGRSSVVAACLLLQAGFKTEEIIGNITRVRGVAVPDTDEQVRWLLNREKRGIKKLY